MICTKNLRFSSRLRAKVWRQGTPGSARAQPCNPSWDSNVKTNLGRKSLGIINTTHYIRSSTDTLKLTYSCMPNMKAILSSHNKKILSSNAAVTSSREQSAQPSKTCNCWKKPEFPLKVIACNKT